jgi:hypothetical protein
MPALDGERLVLRASSMLGELHHEYQLETAGA